MITDGSQNVRSNRRMRFILPVILLAGVSLILGIWTGLVRMGWHLPMGLISAGVLHHGAIMVGGFLGTVILAERVIVTKIKWLLLLPVVNALSLPAFAFGYHEVGFICLGVGGACLTGLFIHFCEKYKTWDQYLMLVGAFWYLLGTVVLWRSQLYPQAFPWWMAFLLWTIAGERMELSRFLMINVWKRVMLIISLLLFLAGAAWPYHSGGSILMSIGLLGAGVWLLRYDMARKTIRKPGAFRFTGVNLLTGYGWLLVSGVLIAIGRIDPLWYDAVLHTFFIGFVFSMIFAHGPIIFPALIGITGRPYHKVLWLWWALLQMSLLVRICADLVGWFDGRYYAGLINGVAIFGYGVSLAVLIRKLHSGQNP